MTEDLQLALRAIKDNTEGDALGRWLSFGNDPRELVSWINQHATKALALATPKEEET